MPASASLFRSSKNKVTEVSSEVTIPDYAVLLWHGDDAAWDATSKDNGSLDGAFNPQYYRRLDHITRFPTYPDAKQISYPIIKCVADDANWKEETGKLLSANVSFDNSVAALLEVGGGHNPTTMVKTATYLSSGALSGDTLSTDTALNYSLKKQQHAGHVHRVDNVRDVILGINFGNKDLNSTALNNPYRSKGFQTLQVDMIIRDPSLTGGNDQLNWLPKNVIVFGSDLPNSSYTRTDTAAGIVNPADGKKVLPLLAKHSNIGVDIGAGEEMVTTYAVSNTAPDHDHRSFPTSITYAISNKTNQTGYTYKAAGSHSHIVEFKVGSFIKSKFLKAWVTTDDKTPIADGIIILYAIGPGTGYSGNGNDSSSLPPNWHFCDGNNGTPDLRDYYVMANFADEDHDVEYNSTNEAEVLSVIGLANGQHSHYSTSTVSGLNGTMIDVGGHGFEPVLNHTHVSSTAISFKKVPTDAQSVTNFKNFYKYDYTPPTVSMAFIMYNASIP